jgi:hypothetical protein
MKKILLIILITLWIVVFCLTACEYSDRGMINPTDTRILLTGVVVTNEVGISTITQTQLIPKTSTITQKLIQTPTISPHQKSIAEMLTVVDAVEKYYSNLGYYPASINDLIPSYINELPFTSEGYEIKYSLDEARYIYMVIFWISDIHYCGFLKVENDWECGFYAEH